MTASSSAGVMGSTAFAGLAFGLAGESIGAPAPFLSTSLTLPLLGVQRVEEVDCCCDSAWAARTRDAARWFVSSRRALRVFGVKDQKRYWVEAR